MVELRQYQKELAEQGCNGLKQRGIVYYGMQVRTGKTLTALECARLYSAKNVLFLTKKKAIASIENDYKNGEFSYGLTVTNYEQLHRVNNIYDLIICDECHVLAAYPKPSLRTKRLRNISFNKPIIFLSGTPHAESMSQLYHQFWISKRSPWNRYYNFYKWAHDYVNVQKKRINGFDINDYSQTIQEKVTKDFLPYLITYSQEQAGFKCEIKEVFHDIDDDSVLSKIRELTKTKVLKFDDDICVADTPASFMSKLWQLSSGTVICEKGTKIISEKKAEYILNNFNGKK